MKLTIIGCSGSASGPESAASCYLLEAAERDRTTRVLLDLGSGAFGQLLRYAQPETLDAVLLSHLHADHVVDLVGLDVYLRYGPGGPYEPIPVWGPQGTADRIAQLGGDSESGSQSYAVHTWDTATPVQVGPVTIEVFPVRHPVPAYAMRVTGPSEADPTQSRVLTYTGDTDACDGVVAAATEADLLLAEAAYEEGRDSIRGIHLTGRRAGEAATAARARALMLTHIPPWTSQQTVRAEAMTAYEGPVDLARAGVTISL